MRDAGRDFRVAELVKLHAVQLAERIEILPPLSLAEARRIRQVKHRVAHRAELDALILRRQEPAAPQPVVQRLAAGALGHHHDERRQVGALAAEPIGQPRADRRASGDLETGLEERDGRVVVDRLGVHRADEAQLVGGLGRVRQQLADPRAGLAVLLELEEGVDDREALLRGGHAGEPLAFANRVGQLGAAQTVERGLIVEQVHLRGTTRLEQPDDALGLGREVGNARQGGERLGSA